MIIALKKFTIWRAWQRVMRPVGIYRQKEYTDRRNLQAEVIYRQKEYTDRRTRMMGVVIP